MSEALEALVRFNNEKSLVLGESTPETIRAYGHTVNAIRSLESRLAGAEAERDNALDKCDELIGQRDHAEEQCRAEWSRAEAAEAERDRIEQWRREQQARADKAEAEVKRLREVHRAAGSVLTAIRFEGEPGGLAGSDYVTLRDDAVKECLALYDAYRAVLNAEPREPEDADTGEPLQQVRPGKWQSVEPEAEPDATPPFSGPVQYAAYCVGTARNNNRAGAVASAIENLCNGIIALAEAMEADDD